VPALFWCQPFSGASIFLVAEHFWCQPFSGDYLDIRNIWMSETSGHQKHLDVSNIWMSEASKHPLAYRRSFALLL
jgi:hypothetical protein